MDERLHKASMEGDAWRLITLIEQDPLILDRRNTTTTPRLETPLHIAAMLGHQAFAAELLNRKPGLARELDSTRSSALHLASANGYVEVVEALLQTAPDMCCVCDRDGKNPLQIAAMMGRIDVLREMLANTVGGEAARAVLNRGGNILHLCVEYSQIEALRLLLENVDLHDLVNGRDRSGNTVLHLAVAHKQVEMTEFLVSIPVIDMKAANLSGMTATDILMQRRITDARDLDIEQSLKPNIAPTPFHLNTHNLHHHFSGKKIPNKKKKKKTKNEGDWVERKRSALMVAASLIATMAFQFAVTAPQNMWDKTDNSQTSSDGKDAMYYVRKAADYLKGEKFYAINTTSFIASLSIILLLMSGLPLNNRVVVWTLMMITWIAISAIALSYTVAVVSQTTKPSNEKSVYPSNENSVYTLVAITVFVWICLVTLLLLGHTVRLFVKMVKILVSSLSVCVRRRQYPASAATRV